MQSPPSVAELAAEPRAPAVVGPGVKPPDTAVLDLSLARGLAWTGALRWTGQMASWASTLVVARLLSPDDYGLVGLATIYLGFVTLLSEFGIGIAVVTVRELSAAQIAQVNTLAVLLGLVGFLVSCLAAAPLGWFFDAPKLPAVVAAMSVTFVISAFRTVPFALLQRDLRFKLLAALDGGQALVVSGAAAGFALLGLGYWTLVLAGILGAFLSATSVLAVRRAGFAWPRLARLRLVTTFTRQVLVSRIAWYVYTDAADSLVAGKMLGPAALGAYNFAFTLATLPVEKVTTLVGGVMPSVLSAVQSDKAALRRYLLGVTEGIALLTVPATLGLAAVAEPFVLVVLGEKWRPMIVPLQLLGVYGAVRSVTPLLGHVLTAVRDTRFLMWWTVAQAVVMPLAFLGGSHWGAAGIAGAWMVVHPLVSIPFFRRTFIRIDLSLGAYVRALSPALTSSALMLVAVWAAGELLPTALPPAAALAARVIVGAMMYGLTLLVLHRERVRAFVQVVRQLRG